MVVRPSHGVRLCHNVCSSHQQARADANAALGSEFENLRDRKAQGGMESTTRRGKRKGDGRARGLSTHKPGSLGVSAFVVGLELAEHARIQGHLKQLHIWQRSQGRRNTWLYMQAWLWGAAKMR